MSGVVERVISARGVRYAAAPLASIALYWLAFYPGVIGDDAWFEYAAVERGALTDWHPYMHLLLFRALVRPFGSFAVLTAVQGVAWAAVVGALAAAVESAGASRRSVWIVVGVLSIGPVIPLFAINAWKDSLFTLAALWATSELLRIACTPSRPLLHGIRLALALILLAIMRHPGVVTVVLIVLGALLLMPDRRRTVGLAALGALVFWAAVRWPLASMLKVEPAPAQQTQWLMLHHVGAAIDAEVPMTTAQRTDAYRVMPERAWREHYRCTDGGPLQLNGEVDAGFWNAHPDVVPRLWRQLVLRHPAVLAEHLACATRYLYYPLKFVATIPWSRDARHGSAIVPNSWGVEVAPRIDALNRILSPWVAATVESKLGRLIVWSPATYLYVLLVALVVAWRRVRSRVDLLAALPAFASLLPFVPLAASANVRYVLPIVLWAPFAVALAARRGEADAREPSTRGRNVGDR